MILSLLLYGHGFSTKRIGYNTNCNGAVTKSDPMDTSRHCIITNTLSREIVTKCNT